MRIVDVQTHLLDYALPTPFESASMRFDRRQHLLVEVVCDNGLIGWGECLGPVLMNAAVVEAYKTRIIGKDPLETEKIWLDLYHTYRDQGQRGISITALSGIDIALWDIKGKFFKKPVSTLLGGRFRESVKAYATGSFKLQGVDRISSVVQETLGYKAEGFHAIKMKIGFNKEEDLELIRQVREAVGPDMRLMIDANHGYQVDEAIAVGIQASQYDIDWFEEPIVPEWLDAYRDVKKGQPIPVAAGETWHSRWGMQQPIQQRLVNIIQPDVCGVGGFTEMKRVVDMAQLVGVRVVPHVWGTAVQIAASLQVMANLPPAPVRIDPLEPIFEFDRTHNPFRQAVVHTPIEHVNGILQIPDKPGLGIEINREALEEYRLKP
ncbi:mandelate racemase/muconate lactonizing enzyme family protein [Nitrincola sp. MINF-07-Sa-05]|uniref:mandelate racemase/muconate lactonizing enzyme family protein n=1 Tax=Nitrincola salilacus TaxID=3400273 RepID=UPI003918106D